MSNNKDNKEDLQNSTNYQSILTYYKQKVEDLQKERQDWLAKFDECASRMAQKHQKQQKLRKLRINHGEADFNIVHHNIAKIDEQLSSLIMDRQNQGLQFQEAENLIKMEELALEFPMIVDKCIPCIGFVSGQVIDNELNLHNKGNGGKFSNNNKEQYGRSIGKSGKNSAKRLDKSTYSKGGKTNSAENFGKKNPKKSLEQIMKMNIIQTKRINDKEIALMQQQQKSLEDSIRKLKQDRKKKNNDQKGIIKQFQKKYNELEKKHKQLAEDYFALRRKHKQNSNNTIQQNKKLKKTYSAFEEKINQAMRIYQKQNKAKQALIIKKSQDFQQDYKARMRAKQRNLQALKENYQKMQQLCIQKVRKLQATVQKAKYQLQDIDQRRKFVVQQLRQQLRDLQKRVNEQRIQKAKIDMKLKQRMFQQKQREQAQRQQRQKQRKAIQRDQQIKQAYKKTGLPYAKALTSPSKQRRSPSAEKKKGKGQGYTSKQKQNKKKKANNAESSGEEDSLEEEDLDKIRKQITDLQKKIAKEEEIE